MKVLNTILYYILLLLVAIGDSVIFLFKKILNILESIIVFIVLLIKKIFSIIRFILIKILFVFSIILDFIISVKIPRKKFINKYKHKKHVTVFKPKYTFIKIKYFLYGTLAATIFVLLPLAFFLLMLQLPNPKSLTERQIPQTTKIYDRNGVLLSQIYGPFDRTLIQIDEIPDHLKKATIAIEDKNFYYHIGFDITAILRALRENISGRSFQGGSTITQQLIKSSFLTNDPNLVRKTKEIILAFWTERIYTKDEILEMYFNQIPYGGTAWGIASAAEIYFGKDVKDLNLPESAFLAGITTAPSKYSPYGSEPNLWKIRQREVLQQMVRQGYISKKQADDALKQELRFRKQQIAIHAPHFVSYIKNILAQKYGIAMVERGGLKVTTTLDLSIQNKAEEIVRDEVEKEKYLNLSNGALLVTSPKNGDILAMVGSHDFFDPNGGNVNITTSLRQPGSSIKIITYALALSKDMTAVSIIDDSPSTFTSPGSPPYSPVNYSGRYMGRVPLRLALANSLNIPAVKILNQYGLDDMVSLAKKMGITTWNNPSDYGLSITLGAAEVNMIDMAVVYGTLANQGKKVDANPILKITDVNGSILEEKHISSKEVLDKSIAFIMSDILSDNGARSIAFGSNSPLNIPGSKVSVKTGTTDNKRDNWTIGYTGDFVVASWVGNNDNSPMSQNLASGITGAAPIWRQMTEYLLSKYPWREFEVPENIIIKECLGRREFFKKGTESNAKCSFRYSTPTPKP